ncbi:MAG: hydrogenase iron-sulfur subunit [Candidatus Nezhaarchaeota archaeon]|nr:hydrogenase iron-sulfur subunit [Candidatus Nezhaarchaeota archaeon]MCX8142490.1 hydrogenase iron-sulfur subunit [Candidatus Nezhaarchaeota archaeon]MDW8050537.1 hydrogenase iron-sulfur subunit [Nitrososphaerota archaeon]
MSQSSSASSDLSGEGKLVLFVCRCGTNIAGVVDVERLLKHFSGRSNVVVKEHEHCCSDDGLRRIKETVVEEKASRLIVACCTPSLHGELFKKTAEEVGLNRGYVEIVNIREQCAWVHYHDPERATVKAMDLIEMALAAAPHAIPARTVSMHAEKSVMVIGGGVAGVTAALLLADMGFKVYLVEKEGFIGGHMAKWDKVFPTIDCSICVLGPQLSKAYNHPNIEVLTLSEVRSVRGMPGSYDVEILRRARYIDEKLCTGCNKCLEVCPIKIPNEYDYGIGFRSAIVKPSPESVPHAPYIDIKSCIGCYSCLGVCEPKAINFRDEDKVMKFKVGAIIVAVGFRPFDPRGMEEYGYGRFLDVVTGPEYERMLNSTGPTRGRIVRPSDGTPPKRIAFIQCVGSRSDRIGHVYCSRVCCNYAIKQAIQTKLTVPETHIAIFYIDVRASGKLSEEAYRRAMDMGVNFVKSRVGEIRRTKDGKLRVFYEDIMDGKFKEEDFDLVVLAVGMEPPDGIRELASMMGIHLSEDGFLAEYHLKLNPADTFSKGIYVAGACTGPKDITETVSQAGLAASRVAEFLGRGKVEIEVYAPTIDKSRCKLCFNCVGACPFGALKAGRGEIEVYDVACRGCGSCLAACPAGALIPPGYLTNEQISAMLKALLLSKSEYPLIVAFTCMWCSYAAADNAGLNKIAYPTNVRVIRVPCSARVSPDHILEALKLGADGVMILGCYEQDCHYRVGRLKANERVKALKKLLESVGISPERLMIDGASASEGKRIAELVTMFVEKVTKLGPIGSEFEV